VLQDKINELKKSRTPKSKFKSTCILKDAISDKLKATSQAKNSTLKKIWIKNTILERRIQNNTTEKDHRIEIVGMLDLQIREKGDIIQELQKSIKDITGERNWLADIVADMGNETIIFR
jgi:hypothetical protein